MHAELITHPAPRRRRPVTIRLAAATAALALLLAGCAGDDDGDAPARTTTTTEASTTTEEAPEADLSYVATPVVEGDIEFRAAPEDDAEVTNTLPNPRPIDADPPVPVPLVMLVNEMDDEWVQVYLPVRPNGTTGWIRADEVEIASHSYRIEAVLDEFTLRVFEEDEVIFETEIGVATDNAPTPGGLYYTTELIRPTEPDGVYGSYAYGLSGFSEKHLTFAGGEGQLGIHGTNQPEMIGQAVSAGCIRLLNEDVEHLVETLQLPLGVPVEVISDEPVEDIEGDQGPPPEQEAA